MLTARELLLLNASQAIVLWPDNRLLRCSLHFSAVCQLLWPVTFLPGLELLIWAVPGRDHGDSTISCLIESFSMKLTSEMGP